MIIMINKGGTYHSGAGQAVHCSGPAPTALGLLPLTVMPQ